MHRTLSVPSCVLNCLLSLLLLLALPAVAAAQTPTADSVPLSWRAVSADGPWIVKLYYTLGIGFGIVRRRLLVSLVLAYVPCLCHHSRHGVHCLWGVARRTVLVVVTGPQNDLVVEQGVEEDVLVLHRSHQMPPVPLRSFSR